MIDLKLNYFELFELPARFDIDTAELERRYRELQREVHPDRFAAAPEAERRASMQMATQVNEAYRTLKSPLKRAGYLLQLHGVDPQFETNTAMPEEFLIEQMSLREAIAEASQAGDDAALAPIAAKLRTGREALLAELAAQLDRQNAWQPAAATLRQLKFLEKLGEDIEAARERLES